jgi:hypothetical protein
MVGDGNLIFQALKHQPQIDRQAFAFASSRLNRMTARSIAAGSVAASM